MIRSGDAAFHVAIRPGSPLTIPMMFRLSMTARVSRITCSSVVAAGMGCGHGGVSPNVSPVAIGRDGSHRGILSNGTHIGGGLGPM